MNAPGTGEWEKKDDNSHRCVVNHRDLKRKAIVDIFRNTVLS